MKPPPAVMPTPVALPPSSTASAVGLPVPSLLSIRQGLALIARHQMERQAQAKRERERQKASQASTPSDNLSCARKNGTDQLFKLIGRGGQVRLQKLTPQIRKARHV